MSAIIEKGIDTKFAIEINTSNLIPFDFTKRKRDSRELAISQTNFTYINKEKNVLISTKAEIESSYGKPGVAANDSWVIFMTMARDLLKDPIVREEAQSKKYLRIHFSYSDLARRLGRKANNYYKSIDLALRQLQGLTIKIHDRVIGVNEFAKETMRTNLIMRSSTMKRGMHNKTLTEQGFIDVDWRVVSIFISGVYGEIEREEYLKLSPGAPRKLIQIIKGNRRLFGNEMVLKLREIADLMGFDWPGRAHSLIKGYMVEIEKIYPGIEWQTRKIEGEAILYINWGDGVVAVDEPVNPFINTCIELYGVENLSSIMLEDAYKIEDLLRSLEKGEVVKVGRTNHPKAEVVVDLLFFQIFELKMAPPKKGIKAYCQKIYENLDIPIEYTFCSIRLENKKKDHITERALKKRAEMDEAIERESIERSLLLDRVLEETKGSNPAGYKMLREEALNRYKRNNGVELDENAIGANFMIRAEMVSVISERMMDDDYDGSFIKKKRSNKLIAKKEEVVIDRIEQEPSYDLSKYTYRQSGDQLSIV